MKEKSLRRIICFERIQTGVFATDNNSDIQNSYAIDIVKIYAAFLIVGSHALPIFRSEILNIFYGQWFFRWCVPFFFISSGFFFNKMNKQRKKEYIISIIRIYSVSTVLYLPLIIKSANAINSTIVGKLVYILRICLLGYSHLWYLNALFVALIIWYFIGLRTNKLEKRTWIIAVLMFIGILFDEYHKVLNIYLISSCSHFIDIIGGGY